MPELIGIRLRMPGDLHERIVAFKDRRTTAITQRRYPMPSLNSTVLLLLEAALDNKHELDWIIGKDERG